MTKVTIGVKEHIILRHEIEIEVEDDCLKHVQDFLKEVETKGVEDIEEYQEHFDGVEVIDTFIEEVPDKDDVTYEAWIVDAECEQ